MNTGGTLGTKFSWQGLNPVLGFITFRLTGADVEVNRTNRIGQQIHAGRSIRQLGVIDGDRTGGHIVTVNDQNALTGAFGGTCRV